VTTLFAPLAFLGGFWVVLVGCGLWGLGMGVHESIVTAAVSTMVPPQRRASAYGIFSAASWFLGSADPYPSSALAGPTCLPSRYLRWLQSRVPES
jgi:MFS family permease